MKPYAAHTDKGRHVAIDETNTRSVAPATRAKRRVTRLAPHTSRYHARRDIQRALDEASSD